MNKFYYNNQTKDLIETDNEDFANTLISIGYEEKLETNIKVIGFFKKEENQYKIIELKNKLTSSDYQIIKCYEAFMRQQTLPYNLEELSAQRDAWREEINQLEEEIKQYEIQ
jgi:hypothetical protein